MSQLCGVCRAFPWHHLDKQRNFRAPWWKKADLAVPEDENSLVDSTSNGIILSSEAVYEPQAIEDDIFPYHTAVQDIKAASQTGCHLCRLVWTQLLRYTADHLQPQESDVLHYFDTHQTRIHLHNVRQSGDLRFKIGAGDLEREIILNYSFVSERDVQVAFAPKVSLSAKSPHTLTVIRYWTQKCNERHEACPKASDQSELPTRVICVGTSSPPRPPFLHISDGGKGKYITLSHRWGLGSVCRTTRANIAQHMVELPLMDMSQVFRDAIEMTRQFGFEYLWIDSLCIIQDSPEDWEIESSKMANIYSNAWFTIAAALQDDVDVGLFPSRDPLTARPCRVNLASSTGSVKQTVRIWKETNYRGINLSHLYPLYNRAWVVQEQALSPKILHFTPSEVFWECRYAQYGESLPLRQCEWENAPLKLPLDIPSFGSSTDILGEWLHLIETYSSRLLSFDADRLPALSGMAKVVLAHLQADSSEYVAGLWRRDILHGLVWYPDKARARGTDHSRPFTYVAPSWSWAAINGPVNFPLRLNTWRYSFSLTSSSESPTVNKPSAIVLDVRSSVPGLDPTGKTASGRVTLYGPVCDNPFYFNRRSSHGQEQAYHRFSRDDPADSPLEKSIVFALDVPGETPATESILLQLYPEFALILERNHDLGGNMVYRRIGWCSEGIGSSIQGVISREAFTRMEVVTIV